MHSNIMMKYHQLLDEKHKQQGQSMLMISTGSKTPHDVGLHYCTHTKECIKHAKTWDFFLTALFGILR